MSSWADALRVWLGMSRPLPTPRREIGEAWAVHLPDRVYLADGPGRGRHSPVVVWHGGRPLPHPHASCEAVRHVGRGRFAHVGEWVLLSSADGGAVDAHLDDYRLSTSWWLYRRAYGDMPFDRRTASQAFAPINVLPRDARPEAVRADAEYAVRVGSRYVQELRRLGSVPDGSAVLEIGPGHHLGTALVLAGAGFRVTIADPYPMEWDPGYHPEVYGLVLERAPAVVPHWSSEPVRRVLDAREHAVEIACVPASAEDLGALEDASFDAVVSTAVLEHVRDPDEALRELARVTRPGGVGLHQVDHRDHRDFDRPLEYLCLSDERFEAVFEALFGGCGNRIRPDELAACFERAGFEVASREVTQRADMDYATRVAKRLRRASGSRYCGAVVRDIVDLGCWFIVRRRLEP